MEIPVPRPLDDRQIAMIRATWARIVPAADMASRLFYARLFAIAPQVRPLFPQDMTKQRQKLVATLGAVVDSLDRMGQLMPVARNLGARHADYDVTPEQYAPVGEALVWMLRQILGTSLTPEAETAWRNAYENLSSVMLDGAREAEAR